MSEHGSKKDENRGSSIRDPVVSTPARRQIAPKEAVESFWPIRVPR